MCLYKQNNNMYVQNLSSKFYTKFYHSTNEVLYKINTLF